MNPKKMKKIVLFATGGTISMRIDPKSNAAVPVLSGAQLLEMLPGLDNVAQVEVREFALLGGSQLTPELVLRLAREIDRALLHEGYDGAVVTQGTDTVEEVSYFLDLVLSTDKPVVITAAQRNNSELGPDGPKNLFSAFRVATADQAHGLGVLVLGNDEVLAAIDAVKINTLNPHTFKAPARGPLGVIMRQPRNVVFFHASRMRQKIPVMQIEERVPLIKLVFGMDGALLQAAVQQGAQGIVLEGAGAGNFPERAESAIIETIRSGIPVVIASRCPEGLVDDIYGYPGAARCLTQAGAILAQGLNPTKARVKLMVALGVTRKIDELRQLFEYLY